MKTTSVTIAAALKDAQELRITIPAIQRSFQWGEDQICGLFDSAMRGFPIGTLLLWEVASEPARKWRWYRVLSEVDSTVQMNKAIAPITRSKVRAVIDGQQRLTAFNIGIHGHLITQRGPGPRSKKFLHIEANHRADDLGIAQNRYRFRFLPADHEGWDDEVWVRVGSVAAATDLRTLRSLLPRGSQPDARQTLERLWRTIHEQPVITWQTVMDDDLDSVLNVFIRANSRGRQLGYDDMLLAVATSVWRSDARLAVNDLVNGIHRDFGFRLSTARVIKAALVLTNSSTISFRATALTTARLRKIENEWDAIAQAIRVAARSLHHFGLTQQTLTAENVIIPVATYAYHRRLAESWVTSKRSATDLEKVRKFVFRTLIRTDFWTGAIDPLLLEMRKVIVGRPRQATFPLEEITASLSTARLAKSLAFDEAELDRLMRTKHRDRRSTLILGAMYPEAARRYDPPDKDHVVPKAALSAASIRRAGLTPFQDQLRQGLEELPNLCLLPASDNRGPKGRQLPGAWLASVASNPDLGAAERARLIRELDLQHAPDDVKDVRAFWHRRRIKMKERLRRVLTT